jgi:hypothetical protein
MDDELAKLANVLMILTAVAVAVVLMSVWFF